MAILENPKPGVYEFIVNSLTTVFRRYDGRQWWDSARTVMQAARIQSQSIHQRSYGNKVLQAQSVTLVAEVDGSELKSTYKHVQMVLL